MDPVAVLIKKVLFPAWAYKNGSSRLRYLEELERSQFMSRDAVAALQQARLATMLRHAYRDCRFYRDAFTRAGFSGDDLNGPEQMGALPTLTKTDVQESAHDLLADSYRDTPLVRDMTGGSTGSPMVFYYEEDRRESRAAAAMRHDRWTGWDIGSKMAVLWGSPRDLAKPPAMKARVREWILQRAFMLDASGIDDTRMRAFYDRLERERPRIIVAYANTMALFAKFVRDAGLPVYRPQAIICSAEVLAPENRALIEATFAAPVFDRYGSREFSIIASECARHDGMHVNAENLYVEVLHDGRPVMDREGEIVITDLRNFAMPMIRYRTRDMGMLSSRPCSCGRGLPLLHLTGGRVSDFLTAVDGRRVSGLALTVYGITNIPGIRQIQFVQDRIGCVKARIVRGPEWSDDSFQALTRRLQGFLGESMTIQPEFTDAIPLEASGKYRFSISTLPA